MKEYQKIIKNSQKGNKRQVSEIWNETLEIEEEGVNDFKRFIEDDGGIIMEVTDGYAPEYDVKAFYNRDLVVCTFEIKAELRAQKYGSCFVEYMEKGQPSGLALTKSDYYYFHTGRFSYLIPTEKVKQIGRTIDRSQHVSGGINGSSKGFKLPIDLMVEYVVQEK